MNDRVPAWAHAASPSAPSVPAAGAPPLGPGELDRVVRKGLELDAAAAVQLTEVTRLANLNYVFRVAAGGETSYLKAAAAMPKLLPIPLPRERIFFEAEAIRRFALLCGSGVVVPRVRYVDREAFAVGLSDVGHGRSVLLDALESDYDLLVYQAPSLGQALGAVHARSRGDAPFRPPEFEHLLHVVVIDHLLAPGARALFADQWPAIAARMHAHRECLIHGDLWAKNLMVGPGVAPAIVDFEGSCIGDPALDLATLLAVALLPVLDAPARQEACIAFCTGFITTWQASARGCLARSDDPWPLEACTRAFLYVGTMLAARGFGPFAYPLAPAACERLAWLARSLSVDPVQDLPGYCQRIRQAAARARPDS